MGLGSIFRTKAKDRSIELDVTGMTCEHCVKHVREALSKINGIKNVEVILDSQGTSRVTVYTDFEQEDAVLRNAVEEAGYTVTGIRRDA
ncbi:MAG: heavy metal-associated domain-containing protein [Actinomycetaceae bacterium]|nr:heavy metal-associated domain-containing protein [Actinomycetaceae bacterium]